MKIVMLGHSDAGKTTYMPLMYEIMAQGVDGFVVSAQRQEDHHRLLAAARGIRDGRYPRPSDRREGYRLQLRHEDSSLITFDWQDYRGGALLDRSDSPQTAQLLEDLGEADGIVVFVDAPQLASDERARRKTRALVVHVVRALETRRRTTPLVLAFTKFDLFDDEPELAVLVEPFQALIRAIGERTHVHGTIIGLACGPEPMNVPMPVLWCLYFGIQAQVETLRAKLDHHASARDAAMARDSLWDRFGSWVSGDVPYWRLALAHREEAVGAWARLEPLIQPAERLGSQLVELPYF